MSDRGAKPGRILPAPESQHSRVLRASQSRPEAPARRTFLRRAALFGSGVVGIASALRIDRAHAEEPGSNLPPNVPQWSKTLGAPILAHPYGAPSPYEARIVRRESPGLTRTPHSSVAFTPLQNLFGIVTPSGLHFERHHAGVPEIDPHEHRLMVHGMVSNPRVFTMDDILRFPSVSRIHFIECGANTGMEWANVAVPTVQYSHGMLGCSEWTGVLLSTLLDECGVDRRHAKFVLAEGADAASLARSIPIAMALDDVIVAYAQNGEMVRPEQGYPLRLLVPGVQGVSSVKWLRRLKVGDAPWNTREEALHYVDLLPGGIHRQYTWIQEAKSVITSPSGGQVILDRGQYEITGCAWSGRGRVRRVDVSTDGRNWRTARLQEPVLSKALTRFRIDWTWDGSGALLQSRVIDETGYVQPSYRQLREVRGTRSIYHNNAIQTWRVDPSGEVSNVQVMS